MRTFDFTGTYRQICLHGILVIKLIEAIYHVTMTCSDWGIGVYDRGSFDIRLKGFYHCLHLIFFHQLLLPS